MRKTDCFKLTILLSCALALFGSDVNAQCQRIDRSRDGLFITYERTAKVVIDGGAIKNGVLLRLHNNTTCGVMITIGSANEFYKPLPPNPTVMQRVRREIDGDLPDGALVHDVQYSYQARKIRTVSVGGDMFFGFKLLGNHSLLFEVPFEHLDRSNFGNSIEVPFTYDWEQINSNVKSSIKYWNADLPDEIKLKLKKQ